MPIFNRFMAFLFGKPLKSTCKGNACNNGEVCSICLTVVTPEKNNQNPKNIRLENCKHVFHRKCLQDWVYSDERINGTTPNNNGTYRRHQSNEGQHYINGRKCPNCRAKLSKIDFDKLLFTQQEIDNYLTTGYKGVKEALAYIIKELDPLVKMDSNKMEFKAFKKAFKKHEHQYNIIYDAMEKIYLRAHYERKRANNGHPGRKSQAYQIYNYLTRESAGSLAFIEKVEKRKK
jgi:hypothetical protein